MTVNDMLRPGRVSFILGGQFGSEGKGAAAAYLTAKLAETGNMFDIVTTNAGSQSGHTSVHNETKRVQFHMPTASVVAHDMFARGELPLNRLPITYLNAGAIIDPDVLMREIETLPNLPGRLFIHPNAAIITPECKEAEGNNDSAQTKIASTRKGVGEALSRKVLRSGLIARDYKPFRQANLIRRMDLGIHLSSGRSVLAEVPQGFSLGIDQPFFPHCTSRNCTVSQAISDAGIHPSFCGPSMLVLRTFPIRVGNIVEGDEQLGQSGDGYLDQAETSWDALGVQAEITTVTKRVRRVFTFSNEQLREAVSAARPEFVFLAFCDYEAPARVLWLRDLIERASISIGMKPPQIVYGYGPSTADVVEEPRA